MTPDAWSVGTAYDAYIGRWSRLVADRFVARLGVSPDRRWLDVGCGTGALTAAIMAQAAPSAVVGIDPSPAFLTAAVVPRAAFAAADARSLPLPDRAFDATVSGLALNFVPDPPRAVAELTRVTTRGGTVAAYVWDYAEGMAMLRHFWDAAAHLNPSAAALDEGRRFPLCRPDALHRLWSTADLAAIRVEPVDVPTYFDTFDDYWTPFLGGQGPAPGYVATLAEPDREALRTRLQAVLPTDPDGSITLTARAWSIAAVRP
jgi:SAM-dependent methyltransferase